MPEPTAITEPTRHQSGGLAVALAKLDLDALTVADAVADVAATAGENVTTAIRADIKEFRAATDTRFAEVNARFDEVDARFAKVDARFAEVNARFDEVDARFAKVDARFVEVNARFAEVNARFGEVDARFGEVDARFGEVNTRIDGLGGLIQSVQREIATLRWMIGIGFTLLSIFLAISTLIRSSG